MLYVMNSFVCDGVYEWWEMCIAKNVNHIMRVRRFFISIILYGYDDKKIFSSVLI